MHCCPNSLDACSRETPGIFKTFVTFLGSKKTPAQLNQRSSAGADYDTYYPAKLQHREKLPCCRATEAGPWYKERAYALWMCMLQDDDFPLVHDAYLKFAQLNNLDLSQFSAILVDETQDMTEAQLDAFILKQAHADCFVVGDMAQSLYAWRFAAPKELASLPQPEPTPGKWWYTLGGAVEKQACPPACPHRLRLREHSRCTSAPDRGLRAGRCEIMLLV